MGGRITLTHNYAAADANRPAAELKHNVSRVFAAGANPRTPHTPAVPDLTQICARPTLTTLLPSAANLGIIRSFLTMCVMFVSVVPKDI